MGGGTIIRYSRVLDDGDVPHNISSEDPMILLKVHLMEDNIAPNQFSELRQRNNIL